jgi:uncharacterized protein (TIGR00730 family)
MIFFRSLRSYIQMLYSMLGIFFSLLKGIWKISRLKHPPVTIFGGARLHPENIYMKQASELAHMLANEGIPVLNGGGPGIMEAASCGALLTKSHLINALGITVPGLNEGTPPSACDPEILIIHNYAARKWLLIEYSIGYVVFPGGYGTLNEFSEVLTLIQTKLHAKVPIILVGKDYWGPLMIWINESALQNDLIARDDAALFTVTDDSMEAFRILLSAHPRTHDKQTR